MKKSCFCLLATVLLASMAKADTTMTYSGNLPGTSEDSVLFENAHLLAVTGISRDIRNYFGGNLRNLTLSNIVTSDAGVDGIYHYSNDGSTLEAHSEWKNYGYNFGLLLILTQSGNDIRGRLIPLRQRQFRCPVRKRRKHSLQQDCDCQPSARRHQTRSFKDIPPPTIHRIMHLSG